LACPLPSNDIFAGNKNKSQFLDYLEGASGQMKIRLFAYCIMDNHYHLILENTSGMMSDFLKLLNGQYGMYYRKMNGSRAMCFKVALNLPLLKMMAI
jgi:REP element-mobilizing transposase RayT